MQTTATPISRLHDGVDIRPLTEADRAGLGLEFSHLSAETRRRRFGATVSRLSEGDLDQLTNVDHHTHEALAAIDRDTGQIVGVARYIALLDDPGAAEVAIEVADEWQRRGIGRCLMRELIDRARAAGIARLVAYVSADNHPVLAWIARSGGTVQDDSGDARVFGIPIVGVAAARRAA
jgi:RimJ/RimL family protein N-acetyltransferase